MAVEIKELIIKAKVNGNSQMSETQLMEVIGATLKKTDSGGSIKETTKRMIVEECVREVLKELETRMDY
jgi:hypothetical protein